MPSPEQENKTLEQKNIILVNSHIALAKSIEDMKDEIKPLEENKVNLLSEIKKLEIEKDKRENQHNEELNEREHQVGIDEDSISKRNEFLNELQSDLEQKLKDAESAIQKQDGSRVEYEKSLRALKLQIAISKSKEENWNSLIEEKTTTLSSNADLRNKLQNQINEYIHRTKDLEVEIINLKEACGKHESLEKSLEKKLVTLNEQISETKNGLGKISDQKELLNKRISEFEDKNVNYEKLLENIRSEENRIKLGWLRLNKKAKELGVEKELESLQNV